jgi:hypothetical protein
MLTDRDQQANDTGRQLNTERKAKNGRVTTRTGALEPLVHPLTGQDYAQWLAAAPNPQQNWVNWQAWLFPPDMAAVYAIQGSKKYHVH